MSKKTKGNEQLHQAEGDHLIDYIYHIIWRKSPIFGHLSNVAIPDTVIFKYEQPVAWYFTHDNQIKCKSKTNLSFSKVKEKFLRKMPKCGIVATFMKRIENDPKGRYTFHHFDKKSFLEFLNEKDNIPNGILQRFIQPKGLRNFVITAKWSPNSCFFEKTESQENIDNRRTDVYHRAPTVDGTPINTVTRSVSGSVVPSLIDKICFNIVQHVKNASRGNLEISRIMAHFKIDPKNRIYLLFCSSIRFPHHNLEESERAQTYVMKYPELFAPYGRIDKYTMMNKKNTVLKKEHECLSCDRLINKNKIYEIDVGSVIRSFDYGRLMKSKSKLTRINQKNIGKFLQNPEAILLLEEEDGEDLMYNKEAKKKKNLKAKSGGRGVAQKIGSIIPDILKKAYPNLNYQSYRKIKNMKSVLKQTIPVCEECFLFHTRLNMTAGTVSYSKLLQIIGKSNLYGTGRLRPEVLRLRLEDTNAKISKDYKFDLNEKKNNLLKTKKEKKLEVQTKKLYASDISVEISDEDSKSGVQSSFGENDSVGLSSNSKVSIASKRENLDNLINSSAVNMKSDIKSFTTQDQMFNSRTKNISNEHEPIVEDIIDSEVNKHSVKFTQSNTRFFNKKDSSGTNLFQNLNSGNRPKTLKSAALGSRGKNLRSNAKLDFKLPELSKPDNKNLRSKTSMHFYKKSQQKKMMKRIRSKGRIFEKKKPGRSSCKKIKRPSAKKKLSSLERKKDAQKLFKMYAGF